jgi:hypothetical protein
MVGAGGVEPPAPSVSANYREPLCGRPFSQVTLDRRVEVKRSLDVQLSALPNAVRSSLTSRRPSLASASTPPLHRRLRAHTLFTPPASRRRLHQAIQGNADEGQGSLMKPPVPEAVKACRRAGSKPQAQPARSCPPSSSQRSTSLAVSSSSSERSTSSRSASSASVRSSGTCSVMLVPFLMFARVLVYGSPGDVRNDVPRQFGIAPVAGQVTRRSRIRD